MGFTWASDSTATDTGEPIREWASLGSQPSAIKERKESPEGRTEKVLLFLDLINKPEQRSSVLGFTRVLLVSKQY